MAYTYDSETKMVDFHMQGNNYGYIAIGLSADRGMVSGYIVLVQLFVDAGLIPIHASM